MTKPVYPITLPWQIAKMKGETYYGLVAAAYELGFEAGIGHFNAELKARALAEVAGAVTGGNITPERGAIICRALEQLND